MRYPIPLACLTLCAVVTACGPEREVTRVDTGPVAARTFNFIPRNRSGPVPESTDQREEVHAAIQKAITTNLAGKGLRRVDDGGDLVVAYLVIVGNKASTQAINDYFGYGRSYNALHAEAHEAYTSKKHPELTEAGTLLIDLIDRRTRTVVRRNYVTRALLRDPSPQVRLSYVQQAVDEALANLTIVR